MVYNALKLFMEINADYFAEAMEQYKQRKIGWVRIVEISSYTEPPSLGNNNMQYNVTSSGRNLERSRKRMHTGSYRPRLMSRNPHPHHPL